jgi:GT2 family glycosyltransferase
LLLAADGRINNAGGALTRWAAGYDRGFGEPDGPPFDAAAEVAAFCGGAALLRTAAVREVGGMPADFFLYYEDTDLSWRLRRAGYSIRYQPTAVVRHLHSATSDQSSASFAFYNQRNQLLTVLRNAPPELVVLVVLRFLLVTAVDAMRPGSRGHQHSARHRMRVLRDVLRLLPGALRARRANAKDPLSRRAFTRRWLGVPSRPIERG